MGLPPFFKVKSWKAPKNFPFPCRLYHSHMYTVLHIISRIYFIITHCHRCSIGNDDGDCSSGGSCVPSITMLQEEIVVKVIAANSSEYSYWKFYYRHHPPKHVHFSHRKNAWRI